MPPDVGWGAGRSTRSFAARAEPLSGADGVGDGLIVAEKRPRGKDGEEGASQEEGFGDCMEWIGVIEVGALLKTLRTLPP